MLFMFQLTVCAVVMLFTGSVMLELMTYALPLSLGHYATLWLVAPFIPGGIISSWALLQDIFNRMLRLSSDREAQKRLDRSCRYALIQQRFTGNILLLHLALILRSAS